MFESLKVKRGPGNEGVGVRARCPRTQAQGTPKYKVL